MCKKECSNIVYFEVVLCDRLLACRYPPPPGKTPPGHIRLKKAAVNPFVISKAQPVPNLSVFDAVSQELRLGQIGTTYAWILHITSKKWLFHEITSKNKIASLGQCRPNCARGFRVSEIFCKRVPKARACKKLSLTLNPRNPTNRKATTNQIQEIRTFFRLGLGKKTRIHALWGLA